MDTDDARIGQRLTLPAVDCGGETNGPAKALEKQWQTGQDQVDVSHQWVCRARAASRRADDRHMVGSG